MLKEILIDTKAEITRVAVLEDGELAELHVEYSNKASLAGNIYRGKVESVFPGMQCAFVNIGTEKNAYLSTDDTVTAQKQPDKKSRPMKIEGILKPGQEITVQVVKEEAGTKGPRVTMNISLPGSFTVLYPFSEGYGVSRKIENRTERERLKNIARELCPEGMGIVLRTAAEGADISLIEKDIRELMETWERIKKREEKGPVPRCLYEEPGLIRKIALSAVNPDVKRIVLNDYNEFEGLLGFLDERAPEIKAKVQFFYKEYDLFEFYNVESAIKEALSRKVWLKSGGYLVFDYTEAMTVIDVNTGKFTGKANQEETVFRTNCEAAKVIARQVRLRDIGGIILIDFIDMKDAVHKEKVLSVLKEECKKDKTRVVVAGMTNLGLVEMTRKKVRGSLRDLLTSSCPRCGGSGRIVNNTGDN